MLLVPVLLAALAQDSAKPTPPAAEAALVLSGRVVGDDDRPVEGADMLVSGRNAPDGSFPVIARTRSDVEGKFHLAVPTETDPAKVDLQLAVWVHKAGRLIACTSVLREKPPAVGSLVLRLKPGSHVDVRVVGPGGKPVAGAKVVPTLWRIMEGTTQKPLIGRDDLSQVPEELGTRMAATTDAEGRGRLQGATPEAIAVLQIESSEFGRQQGVFPTDEKGLMTIQLAPVGRVRVRVVAREVTAARDLAVSLATMPRTQGKPTGVGRTQVKTDAEGRFEVPAMAAGSLSVNVHLPKGSGLGARPPAGLMLEPGQTLEVTIPLKELVRLRTVTGRVLDRQGRPVAGATVLQVGDTPERTKTESDAQGRFALEKVAESGTLLFARSGGFRFGGRPVKAGEDDLTLTLTRTGEGPEAILKTLAPVLSPADERALARAVLEPYLTRVIKDGDESAKIQTIEALARTEPARVLELIDKKILEHPFIKDMLRMRAATGLRDESPDEALAITESMDEPGFRSMSLIEASDALPGAERARRLELLAQALVDARASKDPTYRLLMQGLVAERWLDLGETERAVKTLREGEAEAAKMPNAAFSGYARGAFAEELAQVDLKAALALTGSLTDPREFDRHHGNIAHELAGRDPAEAERVLGIVRDAFQRDQYAPRVVYRMARVDLDRARRLARAIGEPALRGFALGMAALGLADVDKAAGLGVLAEAFDALDASAAEAETSQKRLMFSPSTIAAELLPVAERLDPGLVNELFWRTLALRQPKGADEQAFDPTVTVDLQLATTLARYDRAIARSLVEPHVGPDAPTWVRIGNRGLPFVAAACVDPRWGVELVEALPDDPNLQSQEPKNTARLAVARVLSRRGENRWRHLQYRYLHLWVPDVEDHDVNL